MAVETPAERLDRLPARTGRHIAEGGDVVNIVDNATKHLVYNHFNSLFNSNLYTAFCRLVVPQNDSVVFNLKIDTGKIVKVLQYEADIIGENMEFDYYAGGTPSVAFTGVGECHKSNRDRRASVTKTLGATCSLYNVFDDAGSVFLTAFEIANDSSKAGGGKAGSTLGIFDSSTDLNINMVNSSQAKDAIVILRLAIADESHVDFTLFDD